MVTFALPDDIDDVTPVAAVATPRARRHLPFANRYGASPYSAGPSKQIGTPQSAPARRFHSSRNEMPPSSLKKSSTGIARNIFQASAVLDSPAAGSFSPNLPQSTLKKVFAPGATPEPSRVYRESTASAAPRGLAARATDKDIFPMRISSPPRELTGEALAQKVPKDWNSKGSIYADQYLRHLCPPELDEEQRRQFFCILDLRRLKYAANEIFARKDWKLNIINFAKEFEKSRSIILLRYGLYEFQNVKPSKEVLKRWRREHGLPEPEEEQTEVAVATPSKVASSKKRGADDDLTKDTARSGKRMMTEKVDQNEASPATTPQPAGKNKRKASVEEEEEEKEDPPAKRATPSATKTLFEKIASKTSTPSAPKPATPTETAASPTANIFANKSASSSLARSVFTNLKAGAGTGRAPAAPAGGNNIFGYLSDASSAKNSGADADAESDTDSEQGKSSDAGQNKDFSAPVTSAEEAPVVASTTNSTRENSPSRSLFDRVTKGSDGEPVRAAETTQSPAEATEPADKTWNPSTTPLKFAPSSGAGGMLNGSQSATTPAPFNGVKPAATSNLFSAAKTSVPVEKPAMHAAEPASSSSSVFAPKSTAPSNIFGVDKSTSSSEKPSAAATVANNDGGESDKENDSQPAKKAMFEFKPTGSASSSSLFGSKPTTPSTETPAEPTKPTTNLFSLTAAKSASSTLFGDTKKNDQPSMLFGAKPTEEASKPVTPTTAAPLFSGDGTTSATNTFSAASAAPSKTLFGSTAPKTDAAAPPAPVASTPAIAKPAFSFGGNSTTTSQPDSKSLAAPNTPSVNKDSNTFGSPMRQDEQSPANSTLPAATTPFAFAGASSAPSVNLFGGASGGNVPTNGKMPIAFGITSAPSTGSGGFGFNFTAGSKGMNGNANTSFNNPFATNNGSSSEPAASTGNAMFGFGGNSAAAAPGLSASFPQFGGAGGSSAPNGGGSASFGSGNQSGNSTPLFGGGATAGGAPAFNFTAATPAQPQGNSSVFGSGQGASVFANLQPPVGGSSTAGTNSPLNLGGGSSLATTPAAGTPKPGAQTAEVGKDKNDEEEEKHEQINLTEGGESEEETIHEVRAKVLKFVSADEQSEGDDKPKSKSPWTTKGVGPLRVLKHKETNTVRLLLRAEPRGNVALNKTLLTDPVYKADEKYVRLTTSNEAGDGLETWMIQVKTKDLAQTLAETLEKNKVHNKKE